MLNWYRCCLACDTCENWANRDSIRADQRRKEVSLMSHCCHDSQLWRWTDLISCCLSCLTLSACREADVGSAEMIQCCCVTDMCVCCLVDPHVVAVDSERPTAQQQWSRCESDLPLYPLHQHGINDEGPALLEMINTPLWIKCTPY